jgi:hypothetical protein
MPGFDRTGPRGAGATTGRGRGWGRRQGGFGPGGGAVRVDAGAPSSPEEERLALKGERNRLKAELARTEERLRDLGRELREE